MRRRLLVLAVAAVTCCATTLTGCATATPQTGPPLDMAPVRVAAGAAPGSATAGVLTPATLNTRIAAAELGVDSFDFTWTITDASGEGMALDGSVLTTPDGHDFAMTLTSLGEVVEMRMIHGTMYMKSAELTGGAFLVLDAEQAASTGFTDLPTQLDPLQGPTGVTAAIVDVVPVGPREQLDGVDAQRYDVTFDTSKIPAELMPTAAPGDTLAPTVTFSYWLGPDDLPRKMVMGSDGTTMEMTFTHYGAGAGVFAPTADEIAAVPPAGGA